MTDKPNTPEQDLNDPTITRVITSDEVNEALAVAASITDKANDTTPDADALDIWRETLEAGMRVTTPYGQGRVSDVVGSMAWVTLGIQRFDVDELKPTDPNTSAFDDFVDSIDGLGDAPPDKTPVTEPADEPGEVETDILMHDLVGGLTLANKDYARKLNEGWRKDDISYVGMTRIITLVRPVTKQAVPIQSEAKAAVGVLA